MLQWFIAVSQMIIGDSLNKNNIAFYKLAALTGFISLLLIKNKQMTGRNDLKCSYHLNWYL